MEDGINFPKSVFVMTFDLYVITFATPNVIYQEKNLNLYAFLINKDGI